MFHGFQVAFTAFSSDSCLDFTQGE